MNITKTVLKRPVTTLMAVLCLIFMALFFIGIRSAMKE